MKEKLVTAVISTIPKISVLLQEYLCPSSRHSNREYIFDAEVGIINN